MYKIKKQDKKAWIRILEAFIAITIIFTVTIFVYSKTTRKVDREDEILRIEKIILDEIANNEAVRTLVLENKTGNVEVYIGTRMPASLEFNITICELYQICSIYKLDKDVYVQERVISSTLEKGYKPKKLSLFVWEK